MLDTFADVQRVCYSPFRARDVVGSVIECTSPGKNYVASENTLSSCKVSRSGQQINLEKIMAIAISYCGAVTRSNGILQCSDQALKLW